MTHSPPDETRNPRTLAEENVNAPDDGRTSAAIAGPKSIYDTHIRHDDTTDSPVVNEPTEDPHAGHEIAGRERNAPEPDPEEELFPEDTRLRQLAAGGDVPTSSLAYTAAQQPNIPETTLSDPDRPPLIAEPIEGWERKMRIDPATGLPELVEPDVR